MTPRATGRPHAPLMFLLFAALALLSACAENPVAPRQSVPSATPTSVYGGVPLLPAQAPLPVLRRAPAGLKAPAVPPAPEAGDVARGTGDQGASTAGTLASSGAVRQLFLENLTTGDRVLWTSTGGTITGTRSAGYVPPQWQMRGAGDINSDGKEDIVWQDTTTGGLAVWFLDGNGWVSASSVLGAVPPEWKIVGVGDYNNDGKDDLLWWHEATGTLLFWYMDGAGGILASYCPGAVPAPWKPTAARDLNGDGKDDILWQNTVAGTTVAWYMSGGAVSGSAAQASVPPTWSEVGTADLNGDGRQDIVWQNVSAGALAVWYTDGAGNVTSTASLPAMSAGYRVGVVVGSPTGPGWLTVQPGANHVCGLTAGHVAYCWGWSQFGQLGATAPEQCADLNGGSKPCSSAPIAVSGGLRFQSLAVGDYHTCGVTLAGEVYCWGAGVPDVTAAPSVCGSTPCAPAPTLISGLPAVVEAAAGYKQTCARTAAGAVYCWGGNDSGAVGSGSVGGNYPAPVAVSIGAASSIRASSRLSCALVAGAPWCWGGIWDHRDSGWEWLNSTGTPQLVPGGVQLDSLAQGSGSVCGLTAAGAVLCWGANSSGEFGTGDSTGSKTPVPAAGGLHFNQISVGISSACGIAGGVAYCWGDNSWGNLGTGDNASRLTPAAIRGGLQWREINAPRSGTACGVTTGGDAYCWGLTATLQSSVWSPTLVPLPGKATLAQGAAAPAHHARAGSSPSGRSPRW